MSPAPVPDLVVGSSDGWVKVSVVDTTAQISGLETSILVEEKVGALDAFTFPAYSFLVENESRGQKVLFDLGIPKGWDEKMAAPIVGRLKKRGWTITVEKGVAETLTGHAVALESINAIIWSHCHFDHVGDPATFPTSTSLVVGPDGQRRCQSNCDASFSAGREVRELGTAEFTIEIAGFPALDYFGDGSFYLLYAPGHTGDHLCALARTTVDPPSFIFMAADAVHHIGELRPSQYVPLPKDTVPDPTDPRKTLASEMFRALHPHASDTEPFLHAEGGEDPEANRSTVQKLKAVDAREEVLMIAAHDGSLLNVLEFFPTSANHWKSAGWRNKGYWTFLGDFLGPETKS